VKHFAPLLFCIATAVHATNFSGTAAMNGSGLSTVQTAGITGTDMAVFFFVAPNTPGQTYLISVTAAPKTPTIQRSAFVSDGTYDIAYANGYSPQFLLQVGDKAGQLQPGGVYELWIDNIDSTYNFSCHAALCDLSLLIESVQAPTAIKLPRLKGH
jgi:hypothetical protein